MRKLGISSNNKIRIKKRILISIPDELKEQLTDLAKKEDRSLTNLIFTILKKHVEENTCD